jgi:hypothetical protein
MKLKIKIPGLTKGSALRAIFVFPGIVVWLIPFIIALFMPQKNFQARLNNEFNNINEFKRLLEQ